jgi:4-hydroxyphenylpyruvate dioxygenase
MQTAIATVCLSGTLGEKIEAIAAAGFKGVELFENDLLSFDGSPADVRRMIEDRGMRTVTFQPFRDFEGMPDHRRERMFQRAERKFKVMEELGCDLLMVCSNVSPESIGGIDRAAADLRELGKRAAEYGIRIGFEALSWGAHIHDYRDAWEAVRRAEHPAVGLVLDTFHILARKTELTSLESIPSDRIFLVQLADAPVLNMDYLSWSRHYRCFPGQGALPLNDFMTALAVTGYDGILSLEIFNDEFRAGLPRSVAIDAQRSLIFMQEQIHLRDAGTATPPRAMPPRAKCLGTEFIEFAMDDRTAKDFETLLSGLGFRKAGLHKSKAVAQWSQGAINLVVNTEKEGFAHAYNITHGTGVCAIGLRVDDASACMDRATMLLDTPFRQAVGPGELQIPAVRGVGGSLLYFTDPKSELASVWSVEFNSVAQREPLGQNVGLTVIDHISQSVHYEELLSWLLFYISLIDVEKTPQLDVLDPDGLVKSQVIQSADGALRIPLNASQSQRTQSSRFLSEYFGSGVQHIALAANDIFAAVGRIRDNGIELVEIPENYYDDLESRTELSDSQLDRLKANNILYDTDGAGEYYQAYTQTFDDRFFFEIVQRTGSYAGFGAANAQIRLAAQTRLARQAMELRASLR